MEAGRITRWMDVESLLGQTAGNTKVTILKIRSKAKAHFAGQMEGAISANGPMGNSTEREFLWL